jgi:DNA-binding NarL/FixJ family response regulator
VTPPLEEWADPDRRDEALWRVLLKVAAAPLVDEASLSLVVSGRVEGDPSPQELQVLEAFSHGLGYRSIGETLGRPLETMKAQVKHAKFLLRSKTTTEACCEALRRGLIR